MHADNLPDVITITRSDSKGKGNTWWWIAGNTKPVKDILSNNGAHWSRRRQAWYYIGSSLPAAIQALQTPMGATSTTAIPSGVQQAQVILDQLFEAAVAGDPVERAQQHTKHLIAKLHILRDRDFPGSKNFHWQITGTPSESESAILRQHCHRNETWKVWTYFHEDLPEAVQQIVIIEGAETEPTEKADSRASEDFSKTVPLTHGVAADDAKSDEPETVRIIKPQSHPEVGTEPDAIQAAITQAKSAAALPALSTTHSSVTSSKRCTPIGQQYIGELTGNISGNVLCFGYAIHEGVTVYVNLGGPRMAVEAIRAKLGKGEVVNLTPWDGPAIELTAGEGNTGRYKDFFAHLPEAKFTSLILVHEMLVAPSYGGKSTTFIIRTSDEQAIAQLKQHVTELVNIPIFDTWAGYLWQAGQAAMLVRRTHSGGDIDMWTITLDIDAWTRLITGGLDQGVLTLAQLGVKSTD